MTVVWDKSDYLKEAYGQLQDTNTYEKADFRPSSLENLVKNSNAKFHSLFQRKLIDKKSYEYLKYPTLGETNLGKMYLLPKIHKRLSNVPGRAVISNCGAPTERASEFLDSHLKPIMQGGKSYIRDSLDFINKSKTLGTIPDNAILVTADVVGLYPSIPHQDGLNALRTALNTRERIGIPTEDLVSMAKFVLENNYFEFNSEVYHQLSGTAIGTKFAPPYACIFMDHLENEMLSKWAVQPWLWWRYIDDIFFIWTKSEKELDEFMTHMNSYHPNIRFTYEKSQDKINFLDMTVHKTNGRLLTDLYCKPTDGHQYLHSKSCHPFHLKKSIVYGLTLRLKRLCSLEGDFQRHLESLKQWFLGRGYSEKLIQEQTSKVIPMQRDALLNVEEDNDQDTYVPPLVITYHPALNDVSRILNRHFGILMETEDLKRVFSKRPLVSFRTGKTLRKELVRAKVYQASKEVLGCRGCGNSRCEVCLNMQSTREFSGDNGNYKIRYDFDCNSQCVVYLIRCKICNARYVGQTNKKFRLRWNNYRQNQRWAASGLDHKQPFFHAHWLDENHNGLEADAEVTIIDRTEPSDPTKRERFWINKLGTSLNVD